jgi:sulfite exporter TauE/SafE
MIWLTAFTFGVVGSFHCIGMCGPIAFALPLSKARFKRIAEILVYNSGRIVVYTFGGFCFGLLGKGLMVAGLQQFFSVSIGVVLILAALFPYWGKRLNRLSFPFYRLSSQLKMSFHYLIGKKAYSTFFTIGLINGLLPCGLVYLAIAGSMLSEGPFQGAMYMMWFGMGTFPLMALVSLSKFSIRPQLRVKVQAVLPIVIVVFGLLFIIRGLNLDIPYISPELDVTLEGIKSCH